MSRRRILKTWKFCESRWVEKVILIMVTPTPISELISPPASWGKRKKRLMMVTVALCSLYLVGRALGGAGAKVEVEEDDFGDESEEERVEISRGLKFEPVKTRPKTTTTEKTTTPEPFPDEDKTVRDLYDGGWVRDLRHLCRDQDQDAPREMILLALVVSAPADAAARAAIRRSWATMPRRRPDMALAFLVGTSEERGVRDDVLSEADEFGDVIVSANVDTYRNMTLKTLAGLEWAQKFCPLAHFVLKVDDDVFVQVPKLTRLLRGVRLTASLEDGSDPALALGNLASGWKPGRVPGHKYFVSERQFAGEVLPDFVTGPSYVLSMTAINSLLPLAWDRPYLHLEDVFLTGIVAEEAGVPRRMVAEFRNNPVRVPTKFLGCTLLRTISIHGVRPEEQEEMQRMARNPICGPPK